MGNSRWCPSLKKRAFLNEQKKGANGLAFYTLIRDLFTKMHLFQSNHVTGWSPGRDSNTMGSGFHKPAAQGLNLHETYSKNSIYFYWEI